MAFTYFFRDLHTLELVVKNVLPAYKGHKNINIWDAGCANGPEPYSLAIILKENMGHFLFRNVQIHASDIDGSNQFGKIIKDGIYPFDEIKRIPQEIREKYFKETDKDGLFKITDEIKSRVNFERHDLLGLSTVRTELCLVVCKNVLLHFTSKERENVIRMFHKSLLKDGFLVMEQTQKLPTSLGHLFKQVSQDGQLYQKVA